MCFQLQSFQFKCIAFIVVKISIFISRVGRLIEITKKGERSRNVAVLGYLKLYVGAINYVCQLVNSINNVNSLFDLT